MKLHTVHDHLSLKQCFFVEFSTVLLICFNNFFQMQTHILETYEEPFVPKLQMASVNLQSLVQNYQSLVLIHNR